MDPRPMSGFRDIYPWPYAWERDIAGHVISAMSQIDFLLEGVDKWTYNNHWTHLGGDPTPKQRCVDLYYADDGQERQQMPIPYGDRVVQLLLFYCQEKLLVIIWNHRIWTPLDGWKEYTGPQGDFVSHIHTEWKADS